MLLQICFNEYHFQNQRGKKGFKYIDVFLILLSQASNVSHHIDCKSQQLFPGLASETCDLCSDTEAHT